jgi:hypothetical protein
MEQLRSGRAQAFIGDSSYLSWGASAYSFPGLVVSPKLTETPQVFLLSNSVQGKGLRDWIDPAILEITTSHNLGYSEMTTKYLTSRNSASLPAASPPILWWAVYFTVVIAFLALLDGLWVDIGKHRGSLMFPHLRGRGDGLGLVKITCFHRIHKPSRRQLSGLSNASTSSISRIGALNLDNVQEADDFPGTPIVKPAELRAVQQHVEELRTMLATLTSKAGAL